jgi:hypothetical protein
MREKRLAIVTDYDSLYSILRSRADQLKAARGTLDHVSGLPAGYVAKLLGEGKSRRVGWQSLHPLLATLGLKLVLMTDPEAVKRYGPRLVKRTEYAVRRARRAHEEEMIHGCHP